MQFGNGWIDGGRLRTNRMTTEEDVSVTSNLGRSLAGPQIFTTGTRYDSRALLQPIVFRQVTLAEVALSSPDEIRSLAINGNPMATDRYPEHKALNPFFDVVMKGLRGLVNGEHYYDAIADDAQFEFLYRFPGWAAVIHGRDNLIAAYSSYGKNIVLEKGDGLAVHHDKEHRVITLEYQVHGTAVKTGAPYDNRFVSIVTIENRKIVGWRDYMDSLAAWQALTAKRKWHLS